MAEISLCPLRDEGLKIEYNKVRREILDQYQ